MSAELLQNRSDLGLPRLQVKTANLAGEPTTVDRIELLLPGFEPGPAAEPGSRLDPGRRVDLPVTHGPARCDSDTPSPGPGEVELRVWLDGAAEPVEVEARDPAGLLPRLADAECAQRAVTEAVPLAFGDTWTPVGTAGDLVTTGVLHVGPTDQPATLGRLDGTPLIRITTTTALPVEVGDVAVEVPVTLSPQRCDPHAFADNKRGYAFGVGITLADAEPALVTVDVEVEQRPALEAALLERCGL